MGTAGEKNLWAERISAYPSSQTTPTIHLSAFPSLYSTVCWYCCAYVLNNNCLSGSSVGHESWWKDCTRAGEEDKTAAGKENEVRLHSHGKDTFLCLAGEEIKRKEKADKWFTVYQSAENKPDVVSVGSRTLQAGCQKVRKSADTTKWRAVDTQLHVCHLSTESEVQL